MAMSRAAKALFYALSVISAVIAAVSVVLFVFEDFQHATVGFVWAGYLLLVSGWVWFDSRIDL